jgi:hypothetical protein
MKILPYGRHRIDLDRVENMGFKMTLKGALITMMELI